MERPHNGFSSVPELSFHHQPCNSSECNFICTSDSKSLLTWCTLRARAQLGTIALSDVCIVPVPGRVLEWFEAICGVQNLFFFFFDLPWNHAGWKKPASHLRPEAPCTMSLETVDCGYQILSRACGNALKLLWYLLYKSECAKKKKSLAVYLQVANGWLVEYLVFEVRWQTLQCKGALTDGHNCCHLKSKFSFLPAISSGYLVWFWLGKGSGFLFVLCVWVFSLHVCLCTTCVRCP